MAADRFRQKTFKPMQQVPAGDRFDIVFINRRNTVGDDGCALSLFTKIQHCILFGKRDPGIRDDRCREKSMGVIAERALHPHDADRCYGTFIAPDMADIVSVYRHASSVGTAWAEQVDQIDRREQVIIRSL